MTYKSIIYAVAISIFTALPSAGWAACYADYKAKQANGDLRLHYGVVKLPNRICDDIIAVEDNIAQRIGRDGWSLLRVLSQFEKDGLKSRRKDAGDFFLKY